MAVFVALLLITHVETLEDPSRCGSILGALECTDTNDAVPHRAAALAINLGASLA